MSNNYSPSKLPSKVTFQEKHVDLHSDDVKKIRPSVEDMLTHEIEFDEASEHSASGRTILPQARSNDGNVAIHVLLMWITAIVSFLYVGIEAELNSVANQFDRIGEALVLDIETSLNDYERAGRWVHQHCHQQLCTYDSFEDLYVYLSQGETKFSFIAWAQNITHEDRNASEAVSQATLEEKAPGITYEGFTYYGMNPNYNISEPGSSEFQKIPLQERPWYMPFRAIAPATDANLNQLDVDPYATRSAPDVELALANFKPVLTPVSSFANSTLGNSVDLIHPGYHIVGEDSPCGVVFLRIIIADLLHSASLRHVITYGSEDVHLYLYDSTGGNTLDPLFLGGIEIEGNNVTLMDGSGVVAYADVEDSGRLRFSKQILIGSREWTVLAVAHDFSTADLRFVLFGGSMIFGGGFFLALWLYNNFQKGKEVHDFLQRAKKDTAIVASLFPTEIHNRLVAETAEQQQQKQKDKKLNFGTSFSHRSRKVELPKPKDNRASSIREKVMTGGDASISIFGSKPIADLFPDATIMCADLVGFTAWSSVREPAQVFTLLETIYHAFDSIAKKRRIFKVETVGDCYVAVAGLPHPRNDHAVAMARFATDCRNEMRDLVRSLETVLGPDTGDLNLRVGLHSGEVTAGVLRGDKGRFQLFGDTMNTASRMESTGRPGDIQVSEATAIVLKKFHKERWLKLREDAIVERGKGKVKTYWLDLSVDIPGGIFHTNSDGEEKKMDERDMDSTRPYESERLLVMEDEKTKRLIMWNVDILALPLKKIVARRKAMGKHHGRVIQRGAGYSFETGKMPLDEVEDIIVLPEVDKRFQMDQTVPASVDLGPAVMSQLHDYVRVIASLYHQNPFHNFEHASHVIMSVTKLLSRIIEPKEATQKKGSKGNAEQHNDAFGITSDPLTQFACALSALIHDVDHPGVPNATLVKEESFMAQSFKNKSVAEQNSVEIGWQLLMGEEYKDLQACIYCDQEEFDRFRKLVVNVVMATDVMDKDLGAQRKARWAKAFADSGELEVSSPQEDKNRKATIVIEYIIQASDIAHTMQHWHIYAKWNEKLFCEMYQSYEAGRLSTDPSTAWYEGEKGFFDFYVIPLAKKLDACGVFGASSHEYYNYAVRNREEWERKGKAMLAKYTAKVKSASPLADYSERVYDSIRGRTNVEGYLARRSSSAAIEVTSEVFSVASSDSSSVESDGMWV